MTYQLFNQSKSTRKFSRNKILIILTLLILISGYSFYGVVQSIAVTSTSTRSRSETTNVTTSTPTQSQTVTSTTSSGSNNSTSVSTGSTSASTNSTGSVVTPTSVTSETSSSTSTTSTTSTSSTTTTTSSTNTTLPTSGVIFTISQKILRSWLNFSSSSYNLVPSWTSVPYYMIEQSGATIGLLYLTTDVAPSSCWGYNGPIGTLVLVNTTGYIQALTIYSIVDSWGYRITQSWLNTYVNRSVFEPLQFGVDAEPVTGATFSSTGVIDGVRDAGRIVVNDYQQHFNSNGNSQTAAGVFILGPLLNIFGSYGELGTQSELSIIALVCLFVAAVAAFELKSDKIRYGVSIVAILFMGFYATRMVSMSDFVTFTSRLLPPFSRDPYFYVLYSGVLITSLIWGRLYCGYLCPFGTFTEFLNKLSPVKLKVPDRYQSKLRYTKYVILAIVVFEVLQGTILYQIEPFGTLFLLSGTTFAWIFLGLLLGTSIFLNRFYCKYICPAGAGLALLGWFRIREIKRWPECKKCMICANQCQPQAIKGDRISASECMNCRGCEKLYLNTKLCPHYALERIAAKKQQ